MKISEETTREELGAIICEALGSALEDPAVLVGGAVAAIYTEGRFLSDDLDFVSWRSAKQLRPVMEIVDALFSLASPPTDTKYAKFRSRSAKKGLEMAQARQRQTTRVGPAS
jgi:hypothetical protein